MRQYQARSAQKNRHQSAAGFVRTNTGPLGLSSDSHSRVECKVKAERSPTSASNGAVARNAQKEAAKGGGMPCRRPKSVEGQGCPATNLVSLNYSARSCAFAFYPAFGMFTSVLRIGTFPHF